METELNHPPHAVGQVVCAFANGLTGCGGPEVNATYYFHCIPNIFK